MRLIKILILVLAVVFISTANSTPIDRHDVSPGIPSMHNKIKYLPDVIKEFPSIYHEEFASMFDDIELYIKSNPIPNSRESDLAYMEDIVYILNEYSNSSLPFMYQVSMAFYDSAKGDLILKIIIRCKLLEGIPYSAISLYWNLTLIKQGDV